MESVLKNERWALIACDVFREEIDAVLKTHPYPPVHWETFDAGLHIRPDDMRARVQARIDAVEQSHAPAYLLLLFGLCGNAAVGLRATTAQLVMPRVHECIALFLGSTDAYLKLKRECPTCYFCSPGWNRSGLLPSRALVEKTRAAYAQKYADDPEMVDELMSAFMEQYKAYNGYVYADFGGARSECDRAESRRYAEEMGWSFEARTGNPAFFNDALRGNWDERFLIVPSGECVASAWDDRVLKSAPCAARRA